ncbi:hypothetical protein CBR_g47053 [Chara braunii]|uniref:Uncharacterized protein n=1 Tax=Chara braunii TaxID=69332 RepID=A0A388M1H2_CHABU|nr:hypothetical protein CBR_g47053 [Chara braunii]|eukprot:GBG88355.1 hypothetical protein CBR_g47053 [Chara braunii]
MAGLAGTEIDTLIFVPTVAVAVAMTGSSPGGSEKKMVAGTTANIAQDATGAVVSDIDEDTGSAVIPVPDTVVIFDFDWTMIDGNSDTFVVKQLGAKDVLEERDKFGWTQLMDMAMKVLRARGKTIEDIRTCLRRIEVKPAMSRSIRKMAATPGFEIHIVSDANSMFISCVLEAAGLSDCISAVHTNPAHVDEAGVLRVEPYQPVDNPHSCSICPSNMCKGLIVAGIRENRCAKDGRIIYLGDGKGDLCPCLRLHEGDAIFARKGKFPLLQLLREEEGRGGLKAKLISWASADDVELGLGLLLGWDK